MAQQRKIIHIDMDAFYASVEQRDFPRYRGQPLIVGGDPDKRGVVAAASYEARRYGIHSAMPSAWAYRRCPQAIFVRPRFEVYRQVSGEIHSIFQDYTDRVEPLSLDEAYLDVSAVERCQGSATLIAREIKQRIGSQTGLTASAGVSYNKFLAKLASDINKPDGLYLITPERGPDFIAALPVGKFHGVGKATAARMNALAIHTGADLRAWSLERLQQQFGKVGAFYYQIARGVDEREVISQRVRKSLGTETTFEHDLADRAEMLAVLNRLAAEVADDLAAKGLVGMTVTVKVKYADFEQVTRSRTVTRPIREVTAIRALLPELLERTDAGTRRVRLLGVTVSSLKSLAELTAFEQLPLFG